MLSANPRPAACTHLKHSPHLHATSLLCRFSFAYLPRSCRCPIAMQVPISIVTFNSKVNSSKPYCTKMSIQSGLQNIKRRCEAALGDPNSQYATESPQNRKCLPTVLAKYSLLAKAYGRMWRNQTSFLFRYTIKLLIVWHENNQ